MATETWHVPYCPANDKCAKGWCRLGTHPNLEAAEEAIKHHLRQSAYHMCGDDEINDLMAGVTIETEEYPPEEAPVDSKGKAPREPAWGKGKGKIQGRSQPYVGKGPQQRPQQIVVAAPHLNQQEATMIDSLAKSASAMRASARFARQAATAFDEEASVVESCPRRITGQDQTFHFGV